MAKNIGDLVIKIGADTVGFTQGLGKINSQMKLLQGNLKNQLTGVDSSLERLKVTSKNYEQQLALQKQKVDALKQAHQRLVETQGAESRAAQEMQLKIIRETDSMKALERQLKATNDQIAIQSTKWYATSQSIQGIAAKFTATGVAIAGVGKKMTLVSLALGGLFLKLGNDYEKAVNIIRTGTGATGSALEELKDDFKSVYVAAGTTTEETGRLISSLNSRTGLKGNALQTLAEQMLRLKKMNPVNEFETLIPAVTRMFQDAGMAPQEYSDSLDYVFRVTQKTGVSMQRLTELMTQFGGPLRQMGFDWQTSAVMLGKFEREGVNTELVMGSLRIALGKMANKGVNNPAEALKETIKQIKEAGTAGQANALALEMFGAKAGPDMAAAIREGRLEIEELMRAVQNSKETVKSASSDASTFAGKMAGIKREFQAIGMEIGSKIVDSLEKSMPTIKKFAKELAGIAKGFSDLSPGIQSAVIKFGVFLALLGPVMAAGGNLLKLFGFLSDKLALLVGWIAAKGGLVTMMESAGAAIAAVAGPVGLVAAAIVAAGAAIVGVNAVLDKLNVKVNSKGNKSYGYRNGGGNNAPVLQSEFQDYENTDIETARMNAAKKQQEAVKKEVTQTKSKTKTTDNRTFDEAMADYQYLADLDKLSYSKQISYLNGIMKKQAQTTEQKRQLEVMIHNLKKDHASKTEKTENKALADQIKRYNSLTNTHKLNYAQQVTMLNDIKKKYAKDADDKAKIDAMLYSLKTKHESELAKQKEANLKKQNELYERQLTAIDKLQKMFEKNKQDAADKKQISYLQDRINRSTDSMEKESLKNELAKYMQEVGNRNAFNVFDALREKIALAKENIGLTASQIAAKANSTKIAMAEMAKQITAGGYTVTPAMVTAASAPVYNTYNVVIDAKTVKDFNDVVKLANALPTAKKKQTAVKR